MPEVLLASDAEYLADEVEAALVGDDTSLRWVRKGAEVLGAVGDDEPDLVILDLQIGNMGGMATCMDLRLEEGAGRIAPLSVLMLLDRRDDVFLARRSEADGWLIKPLDAFRLRRAADALLGGASYHEGIPAGSVPEEAARPR